MHLSRRRAVLGGETLQALIEIGLREAVRARGRELLRRAIETGSVDLQITTADLSRMRENAPA